MKFKKNNIIILVLLFTIASTTEAGFQFNLNLGMDDPEATDTRNTSGYMAHFQLATDRSSLRMVSGFTYLMAGTLTQGEFTVGGNYYPLAFVGEKSPVLPFVQVTGVFGVGSFQDEVRMDTGYGLGVGVDINAFKGSGLTIMIEQHNATESATRTYVGYFWR